MNKEITFDRFIRTATVIVILVVLYFLLNSLSNVLTPFFVAWLVAYLLYPIVCFFQNRCRLKSRVLSVAVTMLLLLGLLVASVQFLVPPLIAELVRLKSVIVHYVNTNTDTDTITYAIEDFIKKNIDLQQLSQNMSFRDVTSFLEERIPQLFRFVSSSISTLIGFICSLMSIIYLFFILVDYEKMSNGLIRMIPKDKRHFVTGVFSDVKDGMNKYFRGQAVISLCVGILFAIGFLIIGIPLAIPLGLCFGLLSLVPYLHGLGLVPAVILGLLEAHDSGDSAWGVLVAIMIVFFVVQSIQDWLLVPRVMGHMTGLNGAVILLALSVWGSLFGFIGLIIALPLTTLVISYYKRFVLDEGENK